MLWTAALYYAQLTPAPLTLLEAQLSTTFTSAGADYSGANCIDNNFNSVCATTEGAAGAILVAAGDSAAAEAPSSMDRYMPHSLHVQEAEKYMPHHFLVQTAAAAAAVDLD